MSRPSLVLIPGLNNTSAVFDGVVRAIGADAEITAPTLSPLDTVEALADEVLAQAPPRFHLVGFSFGAYVAMAMLERAPDRIEALCLIGARPGADAPDKRPMREGAIAKAREDYLGMVSAGAAAAFHPDTLKREDIMQARAAMVRDYGAERFIAHTTAAMNRPDRRDLLKTLQKPLLLIAGETDPLAPLAALQETAAAAPKSEILVIANAGHLAPLEQPDIVAGHIKTWLRA